MIQYVSVAAATAVVGYDIFQGNNEIRQRNYGRVITGVGVCGSAAAADCDFDMFVNGLKVGRFTVMATGFPTRDHILPQSIPVPANALVEAKMVTAPTTNPINVLVETAP